MVCRAVGVGALPRSRATISTPWPDSRTLVRGRAVEYELYWKPEEEGASAYSVPHGTQRAEKSMEGTGKGQSQASPEPPAPGEQ